MEDQRQEVHNAQAVEANAKIRLMREKRAKELDGLVAKSFRLCPPKGLRPKGCMYGRRTDGPHGSPVIAYWHRLFHASIATGFQQFRPLSDEEQKKRNDEMIEQKFAECQELVRPKDEHRPPTKVKDIISMHQQGETTWPEVQNALDGWYRKVLKLACQVTMDDRSYETRGVKPYESEAACSNQKQRLEILVDGGMRKTETLNPCVAYYANPWCSFKGKSELEALADGRVYSMHVSTQASKRMEHRWAAYTYNPMSSYVVDTQVETLWDGIYEEICEPLEVRPPP